jgi:hypothetical protein
MSNYCENPVNQEQAVNIQPTIMRLITFGMIFLALFLGGCGERGAVVFAPTPLPLDVSSAPYTHPSGAFTLHVPRQWAIYTQNTTTLATAAFTPPNKHEAAIEVAVINLAQTGTLVDFATIINIYQGEIRPDLRHYTEQGRQAMGDGSWRLAGIRTTAGSIPQQMNTFIEQSGSFIGIIHIILPDDDRGLLNDLEQAINTFSIDAASAIEPTTLATLSFAASGSLEVVGMSDWITPNGVYFITGEVTNHSSETVHSVPVQVELQGIDGTMVIVWPPEPDTTMGYGIPPGGFAPFSLRFGQGQPPSVNHLALTLGNETWQPETTAPPTVYGNGSMTWMEEGSISPEGHFLIDGTLTNTDSIIVRDPMVIVTIFDAQQNVIGARYELIMEGGLLPGESVEFHIRVPELGGDPASYFVNIQALPDGHNSQ